MPFNPGQYIYQPRPLQQFDFGRGFRDVINATQNRQRIDNQKTQFDQSRSDRQNEFSAEFAQKQGDTRHTSAATRHQNQVALVDAATKAAQAGDWNTARALLPRILELGGEASESGSPDSPVFRFKSGAAPERAPLDFGGARRGIYGQQGPSVSQPFQVPGFGAGGQRNPLDPPALQGSAASALPSAPNVTNQGPAPAGALSSPSGTQTNSADPPPDAAGPPPGAAIDGPRTPPDGAVWLPPEASASSLPINASSNAMDRSSQPSAVSSPQAPQSGSPQLTGPNPFDPYTIDTAKVTASNRLRLDPMLQGIVSATPQRHRERVQQFTEGLGSLRLSPTATLEAGRPFFSELAGMYRGEVAAEGQAGRLAQTARHQESVQADKDRDRGLRRARDIINLDNLKDTKRKIVVSRGVEDLLKYAHRNGQAANALIRQLYKMYADGVMTDKDYVDTKEGVRTVFQAIKDQAVEKIFNPHGGGLSPDIVANMREVVERGLRGHRQAAMDARDSLYRAYRNTQNEYEREAIGETLRSALPEEYYPQEFSPGAGSVPEHDVEDEEAVMQRMQEAENLGVVPLPDGAPRMPREPNRAGAARGTRVPPKPPRRSPSGKPVEKMSEQELKEEMDKLLE